MLNLVLLPGMDGTGLLFRPLMRQFGTEYELHVISYPQDPALGYRELTELARRELPAGPFWLLGESFSGPIALTIASGRPAGLRGVILCATFVRNPSPVFPAALAWLIVAPLFAAWPLSVKLDLLTAGRPSPEVTGLAREVRKAVPAAVLAARTRAALRVDVVRELAACPAPLLYLGGTRDRVVPRGNLTFILSVRPDARHRLLPTSHLVLQEAPGEAAAEIKAFIAATARPEDLPRRAP